MIAYRVRSVSQALESIDEAYFESHNEAMKYAKAVRGIIDAVVIMESYKPRVSPSDTQENM